MIKISLYDERVKKDAQNPTTRGKEIIAELKAGLRNKDWECVKAAMELLNGESDFDSELSEVYEGKIKYSFPHSRIDDIEEMFKIKRDW